VRHPSWFTRTLRPEHAREEAALMEIESRRFYETAAQRTSDAGIRQLLDDLAQKNTARSDRRGNQEAQAASGALGHERRGTPAVRAAFRPARTGRIDGRLSNLLWRLCLPPPSPPAIRWPIQSRTCCISRRWHQHGLRRSHVRRWKTQRAGHTWIRGVVCGLMKLSAVWAIRCPI